MWEKAARRLKPAGALTLVVAALCLAAIVLARSADQSDFMPHGFCYLWNPRIVWLHVISDGIIAISYFCIPIALLYLVRQRRDLPFNWIFWMFGAFIVGCGVTHFMEIWTIWHASYLLSGVIKAATAAISVVTAVMMFPLIPKAIALPSTAQLRDANRELQRTIAERELTEHHLRDSLRERELALAQLADRQSAVEELQRAQEVLRKQVALLDLAPMAIVSRDMNHRITFWSRGAEELYEVDRNEALGQVLHSFSQAGSPVVSSNLKTEIQRTSISLVERTHTKQNGEHITIGSRWALSTNTEGQPTGYLEISGDITERKRAEEASERLAAVVRSSSDSIISKSLQGLITAWNPSAEKLFGYSALEAVGQPMLILFPPESIGEEESILARIARDENMDVYETVRIRKDGSKIDIAVTISPIKDRTGQIIGASTIARDITERKRAEETLREQAQELVRSRQAFEVQTLMLQSVLDSMAEGLIVADEKGKFVIWNSAAERMIGYGPADIPTRQWSEHYGIYLPDGVTRFPSEQLPLARALRGEGCSAEFFLHNPKTPAPVWIEASARPLKGKDGLLRGGVVAMRDVTRSKADEREIRKLNEGLEQRVAELARSNADLEQFAYVASHDLQEPLRMVASYTQLLSERYRGRLDANADKYIGYASEGALRMQVLIQDLLTFSRVGRSGGDRERIDCNTVLETVKLSLAAALHESGAVITCPELPAVWADGPQLAQVFQNIIGNAIKFRKAMTPEIEIRVEKSGLLWLFSISDNGIGIAPEYAENIFVVFQRLHARTEYPGNGIGLAICKKIIEYYGGKIWVESQSGQGSTFKFTLPAVIAQEVTLRPELVGAHS